MTQQAIGALVGCTFALGALLVIARLGATSRPTLLSRIAPYVPSSPAIARNQRPADSSLATLIALVRPSRAASRDSSLRARLRRAGRGDDLDGFRVEQVLAGVTGLVGGGLLGVLGIARGGAAIAIIVLPLFGAGSALLLADRHLARQVKVRQVRMGEQLPIVAELLAFAVAAGESPVGAIERVTRTVAGDLSNEFAVAMGELRAGAPLDDALRGIAERTASPAVERFVDGLIMAIERGTPMAEVLRAQAADARATSRRLLMESAGRKDVAMLIPVVFLILPTVVLIAMFPGFQSLQLIVR